MLLDRDEVAGDVRAGLTLEPVSERAVELGDRRDWLGREPEASSKVTLALAETLRGLYDGSVREQPGGLLGGHGASSVGGLEPPGVGRQTGNWYRPGRRTT